MIKSELRKILKTRRKNMTYEEVVLKSRKICENVIKSPEFSEAEAIMVYLSFANEVNTEEIVKKAFSEGKTILVPVTCRDDMRACVLENSVDLEKGNFGINEPVIKREWTKKIDLCIIPGLGFDKNGGRIGFGKGYYDRFLLNTPCIKMGIAYKNQIEENVFAENFDIPMDIIVTESEVFYCG